MNKLPKMTSEDKKELAETKRRHKEIHASLEINDAIEAARKKYRLIPEQVVMVLMEQFQLYQRIAFNRQLARFNRGRRKST